MLHFVNCDRDVLHFAVFYVFSVESELLLCEIREVLFKELRVDRLLEFDVFAGQAGPFN